MNRNGMIQIKLEQTFAKFDYEAQAWQPLSIVS